jgi:hypothetical protein
MATSGVLLMKEERITDALLREFLLGKVADEEQERIENLFLTDPHTRQRVLAVEQELIDDYLEDSLAEGDKERFVTLHAQTDEQRRKLRITRSITDWAATEASTPQAVAASASIWSRLGARLRLKPVFVVPIAVIIVIAVAIVLVLRIMEQRKHTAIQQELAQLNSPTSLREVPSQMSSLDLKPVSVRSLERQTEFKPSSDIQLVELRLPWVGTQSYSRYQVEVRRVNDDEVFTIPDLQMTNEGRNVIRMRLPANILQRGHYLVSVSGIADDGTLGQAEEYSFAVSD